MIGYLYCFKHKTNKKRYIGQTKKTVQKRFSMHVRRANYNSMTHFHKAIRKHGKDAFELEWSISVEIFDVESSKHNIKTSLDILEVAAIALFNTFNGNGYNSTSGGDGGITGDGFYGVTYEQHRKRCIKNLEEHRKSIINGLKKIPKDEFRKRCIEGQKQYRMKISSSEHRKKIIEGTGGLENYIKKCRFAKKEKMKKVTCLYFTTENNDWVWSFFESTVDAELQMKQFNSLVSRQGIRNCANGEYKTHADYYWFWNNQHISFEKNDYSFYEKIEEASDYYQCKYTKNENLKVNINIVFKFVESKFSLLCFWGEGKHDPFSWFERVTFSSRILGDI